jgi:GTPase SAR1 family protein
LFRYNQNNLNQYSINGKLKYQRDQARRQRNKSQKQSPSCKRKEKPHETKVVLIGDQNVGKSSIAQRFSKNVFTGVRTATIGGAYMQQNIILSNGTTVKYHI